VLAFVAVITIGFTVVAGADLTSGTTVPTAATPVGTVSTGPFSSGQNINVVVPANTLFSPNTNINIVECEAPQGVVPTDPSACDGNTINGPTLKPAADGSINYQTKTQNLYPIFALPDPNLAETSGPKCDATDACVLYIGDDQLDFTQPHVWSQPFYVTPNATDSGANPGDGTAPAAATMPSPATSTVVASPATATADGADSSLITVTLLSSSNLPVAGKTVTLSQGSGHSTVVPAATPNVTDANGKATFTVTDSSAEPVTYTATDTTDPMTVTQTATVTFAAPVATDAHSSVVANPTSVATGASSPSTITVTLRDQAPNPEPLANKAVTLAGTGSATIVPAATPNLTNAAGVATFSVTDNVAESATFTATDATDGLVLSSKATVTFGTLVVSGTQSSVVAPSPAPTGLVGTSAVVTLKTSLGDPVAHKMVSLAASSTNATVGAPELTDANGKATFSLTDTQAESVTLTATDTTDSLVLGQKPVVSFEASAPSSATSTISPATATSPADGQTETLITVVIKDQFGNPQSAKTVQVTANPTGTVAVHPIAVGSSQPGVTDATGTAQFEATDTAAESVTFTATDVTDSFAIVGSTVITYSAGVGDPTQSTVTVSPANPPADGTTASTITVTVKDHFGNPVGAKTVTLAAEKGSSTITTINGVTGTNGQATFSATDATAEVVTYDATDVTDGVALSGHGVVTFGSPPAPPPVPADSSVVASPTTAPADGTTTATITVNLFDGDGDPVAGKVVTLAASGGSSKVTVVSGTSDTKGSATFAVSDSTAESVTYTATDTTDKVVLTGVTAVVSFTAVTTTPTTTPISTSTGAGSSGTDGSLASSSGSTSGSASTDGGSSLAFTGVPVFLPWLVGIGLLFIAIGSLGRRFVRRRTT